MGSRFRLVFSSLSGVVATVLLVGLLFLAIFGPIIWGDAGAKINVVLAWHAPTAAHPFGTDQLGRDIFARTLSATQLSLVSALGASAVAIVIGIPLGLLASAFGIQVGKVFGSVIGVLIAFPALLTAMFVGTVIGIGIPGAVLGIGIALAPVFARLVQTLTASVAALDYVAAARTMGVRTPKIIARHILPNVAEPLIITATTSVGISILGISALSFLGLGARPPQFDWGGLLSTGLPSIYFAPMAAVGPGVMIAIAGIGFSLMGESIASVFSDQHTTRASAKVARAMNRAARNKTASTAQPSTALLQVQDLVVDFPSDSGAVRPVRGVTLTVGAGEKTGIVGESGSGKSLTVMAIAQLIEYPGVVDAESLTFLDRQLPGMPERELNRFLGTSLAMVFQNPMNSLNPALRIGGQITETARVHRGLNAADATTLAVDKLTEVGITDGRERLRQFPHEFSGGMRQRAMIAMGLTESPKLIIADEPTTALDVTVQKQILDLLGEINRTEGTAILLISHDIAVITSTCDRVLVMYAGRVVEDLPSTSLMTSAAHPYTRALIDAVPDMTTDRSRPLATIPGRPPSVDDDSPGCPFAARCAFATAKCHDERPPLEAIADEHSVACWYPQNASTVAAAREHAELAS
jgi:peptide/nickel transport system permease protein